MKLKYSFIINELGDSFVAVPMADSLENFNGVLKLNEGGAFIVETLNSEITYDELCAKVSEKFSLTLDESKENIDIILEALSAENLIEE